MGRHLDNKEKLFVGEYLVDLDPKRAALAAGYSETVAASKAYQWVSNSKVKPHVFTAIQSAMEERSKRTEITADRVLQELARLGFADIRKVFTPGGHLRSIHDLPEEVAASIAAVEVVTRPAGVDGDGNREIEFIHKLKFWDKRGSLELLGKHLKLFTDKVEHEGQLGIRVITNVVE